MAGEDAGEVSAFGLRHQKEELGRGTAAGRWCVPDKPCKGVSGLLERGPTWGDEAREGVDIGSAASGSRLERTGLTRRNVRALVIRQGTTISLPARLATKLPAAPAQPERVETVTIVEPGQNRQLASWRFFLRAQSPPAPGTPVTAIRLQLDGYRQTAWPDGTGWSTVEIGPF